MGDITYENLPAQLVEAVPELGPQYETELKWWGAEDPGAHNIFGDVLNPYLRSLLQSGNQEELLRRIFAFLERMANHEDIRVQEVVAVTVCEDLGSNIELLRQARRYMGPTTRRFSHEIQAYWKREDQEES